MPLLRALGYLWSLPHTLVGLWLLLFWYLPDDWRWENGALHVLSRRGLIGSPAGQTHGCVIFYAPFTEPHFHDPLFARIPRWRRLVRHELEHVYQGLRWGPFYVLSYGAHFLWRWCFGLRMHWHEAYCGVIWERLARKAELEVQR